MCWRNRSRRKSRAGPAAEDELFDLVRRAWSYRALERSQFDAVVTMLAEGFATRRGRRAALVHRDEVHRVLHARRGSRMLAITSGGAIPEVADYRVVAEPEETFVGTLNEDFAIESLAGDIFQLGNASWQITRVTAGTVRVVDAHGAPPTIPFWLGEAPARSDELSQRGERSAGRRRRTAGGAITGDRDHSALDALGYRHADAEIQREMIPSFSGSSRRSGSRRARRCSCSNTSPPGARRSASFQRNRRWCWSGSSTNRAACSSSCTRRSAAGSTRPGRSRFVNVSAASSTSSCSRWQPRTRCCSRSGLSTPFRLRTSFGTCTPPRCATR